MTTQTDIPLSKLKLSPTNARHDPGDVTTLANSIRSVGLISALGVTPESADKGVVYRDGAMTWNGRGKRPAWVVRAVALGRSLSELECAEPGYLVEAGGRRLAALHQLRDAGHIDADALIPCMVFDTPSLARSLAENHERAPMDAVQQFQAFARLIGEGRTVHEVGEAFSVTPQFVRQRVKLAELAPEVIDAYRQGRCTLEQMAALTFGTHEQQRAIVADPRVPGAYELRERLRGKVIQRDDRRVKFVGIEAYEAAGGRTITDLFASTADLVDEDILDRLVAEKLQAVADEQIDAGRAFAEVVETDKFYQNKGFESVQLEYLPTDAQAAQVAQIESDIADLEESLTEEFTDANRDIRAKIRDLALQQQGIKDAASRPNTEAPIGVLITLGYHGRADLREVIRAEDAKAQRTAQGTPALGTGSNPPAPAGREDLTKNGTIEIAQHRQAGLALKLAVNAQLALAMIVQAWDYAIFGGIRGNLDGAAPAWKRPGPLFDSPRACPTPRPDALKAQLHDITSKPANERRRPYQVMRGGAEPSHIPLTWYIEQPKRDLLDILAHCVAHALCDPDSSERNDIPTTARETLADLIDASDFNLADVWQPTPEWLKGYGKAKTLAALREVGCLGDDAGDTRKASEIYAAAAPLLTEKRWVPEYGTAAALRGGQ